MPTEALSASAFRAELVSTHGDHSLANLTVACWSKLVREFNPTGLLETLIVRDLARQCAIAVFNDQLYNFAGQEMDALTAMVASIAGQTQPQPVLNARFLVADRLESFARSSARSSAALIRGLRELRALQCERVELGTRFKTPDVRYATDVQCLTYLVRRFRMGACPCRHCHAAAAGCWISARRCWECSQCKTQTCIRQGTVFAHSQVPLVQWFHAVGFVLNYPACTPRELANVIGVQRVQTVSMMKKKISAAILAENATQLLAGLDDAYLS